MKSLSQSDLAHDLSRLGVEQNATLMVHSSLKAVGWLEAGPTTLIQALQSVLGPEGTLVMPSATPQCGDRSEAVFAPATTPTPLGAVPEAFRTTSGTLRSDHPLESVAASGSKASRIVQDHPMSFSEGPEGPFGKLYDLGAWILLLGVGFNRCTALHFAETLVPNRRVMPTGFFRVENGVKVWKSEENVADDNDRHFPEIGRRFLDSNPVRSGKVGSAEALLFPMQSLVRFAVPYFKTALV